VDPSHKRPVIVLGLVAAVLVALFVVSAVHAPGDGGPGSGCAPARRDTWRARLVPATPVAPGQLGGCTTTLSTFVITGQCTLEIAAAGARSRQLVVEALDPVKLTLVTDADGRRITQQPELAAGEEQQIFLGKDRTTIRFRCLAGVTCRARLE
jgi:hypothetical protein